jgi:hypothetical protein
MSKQIVATKDKEYAYYAGADLDTAQKMALIDTFIKNGLIGKTLPRLLKPKPQSLLCLNRLQRNN